MIHQSLYKDFQKLLFLHLGGLFHKLTLALEKWNFVESTSSKQEKWTSMGVGAPVKAPTFSFRMATSFGSKNISLNLLRRRLQKDLAAKEASRHFYFAIKAHKKSYPQKRPSHESSNFRVFFFCWDFYSQIFASGFLLPPWSSRFNAFQLGCHLHKNPTSYITSSSFEAAAHFVCIFQPGNFTRGGTTRNPKSYLL